MSAIAKVAVGVLCVVGLAGVFGYSKYSSCEGDWNYAESRYMVYQSEGHNDPYQFASRTESILEVLAPSEPAFCTKVFPVERADTYRRWETDTLNAQYESWLSSARSTGLVALEGIDKALERVLDGNFRAQWAQARGALLDDIQARTFTVISLPSDDDPAEYRELAGGAASALAQDAAYELRKSGDGRPGPIFVSASSVDDKPVTPGTITLYTHYVYNDYVMQGRDGAPDKALKIPVGANVRVRVIWKGAHAKEITYETQIEVPKSFKSANEGSEYFQKIANAVAARIAHDPERKLRNALERMIKS